MTFTRYARSGRYNIAYRVFGNGPIDIVIASGLVSHVEYVWREPSLARFLRKLGVFARVIMFDKRGSGLSDALGPDQAPSLEERVEDVAAVMDAARSQRAVAFGWSEGGATALAMAERYPERMYGLVLFGTTPLPPLSSNYPDGFPARYVDSMLEQWRARWGTGIGLELVAPSLAQDQRMHDWWATCQRLTAGPGTIFASMRMLMDFDITPWLANIRVPTLVMHAERDAMVPLAAGKDLAARLPNARLCVLPGGDHMYWLGDQNQRLDIIRAFLADLPAGAPINAARERRRRPTFGWESLTPAELDVVWLVGQGFTNPEIARRLYVSPRTVQTHLKHIFGKLGFSRRSEVAAEASRRLVAV